MVFIFIMPKFAATSACYCAAEMVLVLHLLTIFSFLRAFQLEHARTSPITVGRVAGSTLILRRTNVEKIRGPFTLVGRVSGLHLLHLATIALPRVRVGLRQPPCRTLLSRGIPSQMFAHILVHEEVILPFPGQFAQQMDQVILREEISDVSRQFTPVLGGIVPTSHT